MNYSEIKNCDIANGPGVRISLFVSGCRNHCKGCFNQETWDFSHGQKFEAHTISQILMLLDPTFITGLTILGGDPFEPENIEEVTNLCKFAKSAYPNKDIWLYTGYLFENFKDHEIMNFVDVIVDGPFVEELKNLGLRFRGSENQRIIKVKESRDKGEIVLWSDWQDDPHLWDF